MSYFIASCERLEVETAARCGPPLAKFLGFQPVLLLKFKRTAQHPQKLAGVLPARPNPPKEALWKPQDSAPFGL